MRPWWHIRVETPIAVHSVARRVSHQIPAEKTRCRAKIVLHPLKSPPPNQGVAPFSGPPCRTFLSFAAGRGPRGGCCGGQVEGMAALLGSENGSRYRGASQLQSHQSRYSVQLRMRLNSLIATCLNHFVLIEVCSVDILVTFWMICTGF